MTKIRIPKRYVEISREKEKPTTYIYDKKNLMRGRHEKGDTKQLTQIRKQGYKIGKKRGRTRVIRMKKSYKGFREGQIISRTKKQYPFQKNSVLIRVPKTRTGKIEAIKVRKYKRRSKKGKKHKVRKHKRKKV